MPESTAPAQPSVPDPRGPISADPSDGPWYVRHRMRALLATLGGFLLFGAVVFTVVYVTTVNRLKNSEPYRIAVQRVAEDPAVQRQLGRPVETAWLAAGQVNDATGYTEMTFRVTGPAGRGTVRAVLERPPSPTSEAWELVFLTVGCYTDSGVEVVKLIEDKPPAGRQLPEPTPEAKEKYGVE